MIPSLTCTPRSNSNSNSLSRRDFAATRVIIRKRDNRAIPLADMAAPLRCEPSRRGLHC
jgi:hypothetical protein